MSVLKVVVEFHDVWVTQRPQDLDFFPDYLYHLLGQRLLEYFTGVFHVVLVEQFHYRIASLPDPVALLEV